MIVNAGEAATSGKRGFEKLLEAFGRGWERGDAEAIAATFTENGCLVPDPFDSPLSGRDAIATYWKDIPKKQAEIAFRWGEVFVAGPWFSAEIKCTFRRRRTGELVVVRGALFCETENDLVSEMRMYWHRNVDR